MPKLNRKQLFAFVLAYPTLAEQRHIVAYLDELQAKVDAVKRLQAETSAELEALLPSVLDKAFKGEL
jgi:type I restriction enzyme S subunit